MKKENPNLKIKRINNAEENVLKELRNLEKFLGEKVDFSIESTKKGEKGKITYCFSSAIPKIKIDNKNVSLDVEFSSMEQDNEKLLHFLFDKTKK
jgi:hypothetical protein